MSYSNFPNELDYPSNFSYLSDLTSDDWAKIKRYNSLIQQETRTEEENNEITQLLIELQNKHITAEDINKIIDCIRAIEKVLYPISKGNIEGNLNVKGNVDVSGNISGNGSKLTNINADTVDGKHASDFATVSHTHTTSSITNFPTALPANGGNADTVGGKSISDLLAKTNRNLAVESTDFNTITDMGVYTIGTEDGTEMSTGKNQPAGAYQWGTLAVFASGSYGLTQVYYTHTGDTYVRGLYGGDNWNSWKKCGENADTLDGKDSSSFYPQGTVSGGNELNLTNIYNNISAGDFNNSGDTGIGNWGMNISKESDDSNGLCPSLFVSENGRDVFSYQMTADYETGAYSNNYTTGRRTLSVGATATVVVAASDTYPESVKFSADYICNGTNDQNTINAAINNLLSSQGGKVILLNGTYNLSNGININKNNVTIEGMGYSTYLKCDNVVFKMKTASSLSHISIKNLRVYTIGYCLLDFAYSSTVNCSVTDLNLENITNDDNESGCPMLLMKYNALTTTLVNYLTINNCKFLDSDEMVLNRCNNIIFTNNIVNSLKIFGIYYCNNAMVSNNKFSIYSLDTSNNTNILIQNNLLSSYANPDSTNTNVSITNNLDI